MPEVPELWGGDAQVEQIMEAKDRPPVMLTTVTGDVAPLAVMSAKEVSAQSSCEKAIANSEPHTTVRNKRRTEKT